MSSATRATCCSLLLLAPLFVTSVLPAQRQAPATAATSHQIVLDVVVTPKSGKADAPVAGLQEGDFTLLDDKTPHPITSFRAVTAAEPVSVILLVDAVNTDYLRLNSARQQLDKFLSANGGHLAHPTTLAFFTDNGTEIQQNYTTDGNILKASLDQYTIGLRSIRRSAGFYGATERFDLSLKTIKQFAAAYGRQPGRKIIVWVSPGWPLLSGPGVQLDNKMASHVFNDVVNVSTALREARITLYAVNPVGAGQDIGSLSYYRDFLKGVSKPSQVNVGNLALQVLAEQSGGLVLGGSNDMSGMVQTCFHDIGAYYEITFNVPPAEHANEYHSIDFKLTTPGLVTRTRTGYYAQP
ncbi:MAG: VWA domain-containing protein [Granulicella sp.]